jgi:hypothetical protein
MHEFCTVNCFRIIVFFSFFFLFYILGQNYHFDTHFNSSAQAPWQIFIGKIFVSVSAGLPNKNLAQFFGIIITDIPIVVSDLPYLFVFVYVDIAPTDLAVVRSTTIYFATVFRKAMTGAHSNGSMVLRMYEYCPSSIVFGF